MDTDTRRIRYTIGSVLSAVWERWRTRNISLRCGRLMRERSVGEVNEEIVDGFEE